MNLFVNKADFTQNYRYLNYALFNQPSKYQAINRKLNPRAIWLGETCAHNLQHYRADEDHDDVQQLLDG